ncbi:MAG: dTDP-4-dehydrorhamnose 3,5-epimerase [Coriobacteriales bacterium]|jgi:dTDP-4-dehydrorhamnose 3,5-epimerase|nr:dTDP-4-dehydrorhamnose 3,5-epimerase [Coriobacteriales bacterium]
MSNFNFIPTALEGVFIVQTRSFGDSRGAFMETYQRQAFAEAGITAEFVQDNQSSSVGGVLRGLHFQIEHPQAKLVRVIEGAVFDVAVDIRPGSATYGAWVGVELSAENHRQLFIPRGLAHGFLVLSEHTTFTYKCDEFYHPEDEGGLAWDDPALAIAWPLTEATGGAQPVLSEKDRQWPTLAALRG